MNSLGMLAMSEEKRLIKDLLRNYEEVGLVGRPVYNMSQTIKVSYGVALIQILDLEEKNQVLTTNIWCRYVSIRPMYPKVGGSTLTPLFLKKISL